MSQREAMQLYETVYSCQDPYLSGDFLFLMSFYGVNKLKKATLRRVLRTIKRESICPSVELLLLASNPQCVPDLEKEIVKRPKLRAYILKHIHECSRCKSRARMFDHVCKAASESKKYDTPVVN